MSAAASACAWISPSTSAPRTSCARRTGARTNSSPRSRTSCATRWPIRNAVELMRRAGHDPHIAERALAIMERQLHQLVRLTDDLLDMSRITRNTIELRRDRVDLRAVLRSALETIDPLSLAAGHDLTVDLPQ